MASWCHRHFAYRKLPRSKGRCQTSESVTFIFAFYRELPFEIAELKLRVLTRRVRRASSRAVNRIYAAFFFGCSYFLFATAL